MDIGIADPAWVAADDTPRVALAGFEGSLALLVDLARTRQIDLNQLPVADVVDQLMVALQQVTIPLGRKGDWVVLAAWLLLLRSRLLLPIETLPPDVAAKPPRHRSQRHRSTGSSRRSTPKRIAACAARRTRSSHAAPDSGSTEDC